VLRLLVSPRWIAWHLLALGAMVTCGFLAAWQWRRAGSAMGSAVNVGYGLQWPVFAVFFAYVWWRFLQIEIAKLPAAEPPAQPAPDTQPSAGPAPVDPGLSPFAYRPGRVGRVDEDENPALAEYNRMLASLAAHDRAQEQKGR
jgi:DNA-binding transcriptional regulator of glucitol operon